MTLQDQLEQARLSKLGRYEVRTHLKDGGEPKYTNRLVLEDSPYLLQHAHNPVNWYPWGDEAFTTAREENKPVFLSIGYSTCHWCHVMEEESFDNEAVAELLNRHFISIKIDREQRPDLDEIYMTGVQLISGNGGWPMSSFLTGEGMPFYGATYFRPQQFMQLLERINQLWQEQREELIRNAESVSRAIHKQLTSRGEAAEIGQTEIDQALGQLRDNYDSRNGGFGPAPKFPNESNLLLFMDQVERDPRPLLENPDWQLLQRSLSAMLQGGIYDQLGGGFHRYAVDDHWLVPHFEKMLYNQAQLARLYARSWRLSGGKNGGHGEFRRICEETLDYVLREMRSEQDAFYSATDADSEGQEGKFFVWPYRELKQLLDERQLALVQQVYGVTPGGNFEGENILYLPQPIVESAKQLRITTEELMQQLDVVKEQLYRVRQQRIPPLRDDKIITEWNGMMITALAESGLILEEPRYIDAAARAALFIWDNLRDEQGHLLRICCNGQANTLANLEDYSHYLEALTALYDADGKRHWLDKAVSIHEQMTVLFREPSDGGFYSSQRDSDGPMIVRAQPYYDGATPSGNSVALTAMVALNRRVRNSKTELQIDQLISRFSAVLQKIPTAMCHMLTGVAQRIAPNPAAVQYAAEGNIRLTGKLRRTEKETGYQLSLQLRINEGWHINGHHCAVDQLTATRVTINSGELRDISYPEASLYRDEAEIVVGLESHSNDAPLQVCVDLQACDETRCLPPETLTLLFR